MLYTKCHYVYSFLYLYVTGIPILLLIKRKILIITVCRWSYAMTNQKKPEGRSELHLCSWFSVLLINSLKSAFHHFPPKFLPSLSTLNSSPNSWNMIKLCYMWRTFLLNLARKEIQQRKNKLQFIREKVIVSVRAQVMSQLIKWTGEKGRAKAVNLEDPLSVGGGGSFMNFFTHAHTCG